MPSVSQSVLNDGLTLCWILVSMPFHYNLQQGKTMSYLQVQRHITDIFIAVSIVKSSSSYQTVPLATMFVPRTQTTHFPIDFGQTGENNSDTTIKTAVRSILCPHTIFCRWCWSFTDACTVSLLFAALSRNWQERNTMLQQQHVWPPVNQDHSINQCFIQVKDQLNITVCILDLVITAQCSEHFRGSAWSPPWASGEFYLC